MKQNAPLLVVLLVGFVSALGIAGAANLRGGDPGPEDVAIRVNGVEATFAELELRRDAHEATQPVHEQLRAGEDFGLPAELVAQMRTTTITVEPLPEDVDEEVAYLGSVVSALAARAAARSDGALSEAAVADRVELLILAHEVVGAGAGPEYVFPRALNDAQVAALGEERYFTEYLPLQARDGLARQHLAEHLELSPAEFGIMPIIMAMRAVEGADIWLHPSLGVTPEEVQRHVHQQARYQAALLELQVEAMADFGD